MSKVFEIKGKVSVLFVCMGNICRSPTAEGVLLRLLAEEAPDLAVEVDSAGTHAYHVGHEPDRRAQAAASARGVDLSRIRARKVQAEDFARFDYILAMDELNLELLRRSCPADYQHRLRLLMEFAPDPRQNTVPDPYYGGSTGFERVLDMVEEAARGLLQELRRLAT